MLSVICAPDKVSGLAQKGLGSSMFTNPFEPLHPAHQTRALTRTLCDMSVLFANLADTGAVSRAGFEISVESVESWPLLSGVAVADMAAAAVAFRPSVNADVQQQVRLAASALLAEPVVEQLLAKREFVVFARTSGGREALNRLGLALAERNRLWATFDEDEVPEGARLEAAVAVDPIHFCGAIRISSGDEMRALELSYNRHALCVALPHGADLEALAQAFGATQTWKDSLRWAAALVPTGAMVFRPWDWMDDKDVGVELWASASDLAAFA